jgi:hypothetical protein
MFNKSRLLIKPIKQFKNLFYKKSLQSKGIDIFVCEPKQIVGQRFRIEYVLK